MSVQPAHQVETLHGDHKQLWAVEPLWTQGDVTWVRAKTRTGTVEFPVKTDELEAR